MKRWCWAIGLAAAVWGASPALLSGDAMQARTMTLTEVLSIGGLESDTLFMWAGIAVDEQDAIYVTDVMDHSLKKFDAGGRLLKKTGRKGEGPGEFQFPLALTRSHDRLYVQEQHRRGIQVFDLDLNFVRIISCREAFLRIKAAPDSRLAVLPITPRGEGRLLFIDERGEAVKTFPFSDKPLGLMMDQIDFVLEPGGGLLAVFNYRDRIERFGPSGKSLWSKNLLDVKKTRTFTAAGRTLPSDLIYRSVARDSKGRILILSGDKSPHPARDVFVLSPAGELMTTLTLPDSTHLIHIDGKDFLYARADSGVTLKKYRMRWGSIQPN